jgi:two-component system, cell cycle sensor histidine kinase and response regulator CckA
MTAGRYVVLAITDNGTGMNEATRSRIFELSFTTKEVAKGSGLGLATVYGIVKQSGGHIGVYSKLGRGTTFKIYFPSADHKLGKADESQTEALPPKREGITILLAEDEPIMRRVTGKILEEHGYKVLDAADGKTALEVIDREPGRVDLALTDVVMKEMSGPELALRLTRNVQE